MDLFIIVAAVLGVGGVVSASMYNLVSSATTNSSIAVVGSSVVGAPSPQSPPGAISITINNDVGTVSNCTPRTCHDARAAPGDGTPPAKFS